MTKTIERTFEVTITKTVTVRMSEEALSPGAIREFEQTISDVDGPDGLMGHVAIQVAQHGNHFVEGVGRSSDWDDRATVRYSLDHVDVTVEATP